MKERQDREEWTERDEWAGVAAEEELRAGESARHPEWDENLSEKSSTDLENEIRMIRGEMDETLRILERKFSPGELLDRALHQLPGGPKEFASNLGYALRDNPLPAALTGVGIAWLAAASDSPPPERGEHRSGAGREKLREMSETMGEKFHHLGDRMHGGASRARESMHEKGASFREGAQSARSRAEDFGHGTQRQARQMKEGLIQAKDEHPVILAGLGLALGALLGAAVPPTRTEDRVMGEARDRAIGQAKEKGLEQAETAEAALRAGAVSAREETERRLH